MLSKGRCRTTGSYVLEVSCCDRETACHIQAQSWSAPAAEQDMIPLVECSRVFVSSSHTTPSHPPPFLAKISHCSFPSFLYTAALVAAPTFFSNRTVTFGALRGADARVPTFCDCTRKAPSSYATIRPRMAVPGHDSLSLPHNHFCKFLQSCMLPRSLL